MSNFGLGRALALALTSGWDLPRGHADNTAKWRPVRLWSRPPTFSVHFVDLDPLYSYSISHILRLSYNVNSSPSDSVHCGPSLPFRPDPSAQSRHIHLSLFIRRQIQLSRQFHTLRSSYSDTSQTSHSGIPLTIHWYRSQDAFALYPIYRLAASSIPCTQ